ncbi:uncharacterized protein LOC117575736 isoform X2 [Drosophila albomicans]|uniref:Uncharacterized protein LOC117575736 isoform X2 n=1 Tax=Drosophila albomicans TaxID=7291 RepID=A0A6P8XXD2_DROAB|nr:uncharacterized protein LOC117575736 isoform X2 [Drosophila albomicans]
MLQQCIIKSPNGALGLNLSRAPWDPYPWVSGVQAESNAQLAGVRIGDTLLQLNGIDVLGMRISELANRLREHWLTGAEHATMMMWRQQPATLSSTDDPNEAAHAVHGINQQSLQKFATCLQHIAQLLECPVCCDVVKPPGWQCCNGHVLCNNCRNRSVKCPVCRVPLGPRGRCLLSDKLFTLLAENFPCDGVKINKENDNSNSNSRSIENSNAKCTNEYHNQPKMALAKSNSNSSKKSRKTSRQQQLQEDTLILVVNGAGAGEEQAKAMLEEEKKEVKQCVKQVSGMPKGNEQSAQILRNNVNDAGLQCGMIKAQQEQQAGNSTKEEAVESNNMLVKPKLKLSKKSWQITGRDQDELRSDEVANINNGQQRMLGLELHSSGQQQSEVEGQVLLLVEAEAKKKKEEEEEQSTGQQQYQNYHCPTGKSCCTQAKLFQPASANKLSTVKRESATANVTATAAPEKRLGAVAEIAFVVATAAANSAATLSADSHKATPKANAAHLVNGGASIKMLLNLQPSNVALEPLNVVHFDGTFGQRLRVHVQLRPQQTQVCLRLSEEPSSGSREVQTFFLALLPWHDKYAVFLWHLNAAEQEPAQHFQTVIEAQGNRVKWFGQAQPVTRSWPEICAAGQFLTWMDEGQQSCTAFDIIVKRK